MALCVSSFTFPHHHVVECRATAWTQALGDDIVEPASKRQATGHSKQDKVIELAFTLAKFGLKVAQDASVLAAICYRTLDIEASSPRVVKELVVVRADAEQTRGVSKHQEGAPDAYACMGVLLEVLLGRLGPPEKELADRRARARLRVAPSSTPSSASGCSSATSQQGRRCSSRWDQRTSW